jgi:hypothetical protein
MSLIDSVKAACDRLAPLGWRDLLKQVTSNALDIQQATTQSLATALAAPLASIDRSFPGFVDFGPQGQAGITPGAPAHSLLYHALASPAVRMQVNGPLAGFPTPLEIEAVENYVFGVKPPTPTQLRQSTGGPLSVVVFAYEYRSSADTCSQLQADLVFSRTGISRVGTRDALYNAEHRGYQSEAPDDPFAFHVCPAHFGVFLAIKKKGSRTTFTPMRAQPGDTSIGFWVPVHKLFSGTECIQGLTLKVEFSAFHYNDKIRRVQVLLQQNPPNDFPFRFSDGIAEFRASAAVPPGLLFPTPHPRLVEPAMKDGNFVTYRVPPAQSAFAAFEPGADRDPATGAEVRPAPAYVHARTQVRNGALVDLGDDPNHPDVLANVSQGNYDALHYVDFTGEGQIDAAVDGLPNSADIQGGTVPAYSLVSAPDFFPSAGQRELSVWSESPAVPAAIRKSIWGVQPVSLCDTRLPPNLQTPGNRFDPQEVGVTALVPMLGQIPAGVRPSPAEDALRHSCLPDDAAGVFAPGWDVSTDKLKTNGTTIHHLAAYGLGSPFPEDSKLCAALSTFWPTVAADITRGMSISTGNPALRHTVAPLTDEEIGQTGSLPWDGNAGPKIVTINGQDFIESASFLHVDYIQTALEGRFTSRLTARVTTEEYERRLLAMAFVYRVVGGSPDSWFVLSFRRLAPGDPELQQAQIDASSVLPGTAYRFDVSRSNASQERVSPSSFRRRLMPLTNRRFLVVDPRNRIVLQRRANQPVWARATLTV